jgi:hypothetical protein
VYNTNTITAKPTALNSNPAKEQDKAESKTKLSYGTLNARAKKKEREGKRKNSPDSKNNKPDKNHY